MKDIKVKLKRFGTITVNKKVRAHNVGNLWHIFIFGDWHTVPDSDVIV